MIEKSQIDLVKEELSKAKLKKIELEESFNKAESKKNEKVKTLKKSKQEPAGNELDSISESLVMESYRVDCLAQKIKQMERQNEIEQAEKIRLNHD